MSTLVHEVWEEVSDGMVLHRCCLAGPGGDGCRRTLAPDARLLTAFEASSHFKAMTEYNRFLGRGAYTTNEPLDYQPYPEEWLAEQQSTTAPGTSSGDEAAVR